MSSIRSLVTITVLAGVGIFLYLKINETEPILPEEVAGFQIDGGLDFDTEFQAMPDFVGQSGASEASAPGGSAPAFSVGASTPVGGAAPTFSPTPMASQAPVFGESEIATSTLPVEEAGVAVPDLPPLPTIPSAETVGAAVPTQIEQAAVSPAIPSMMPPAAIESTPQQSSAAEAQASLFSATRIAVEAALDRGQLSQALLLLSDWYGDPSLSPQEKQEVNQLLGQLAGSVIYSTEHRLEPPYMVQSGERLQDIAARYEVPWQLLAKINGITNPDQLQTGQQLKVMRGPFSATIDLSQQRITLMLNRRYAGQFTLEVDPVTTVEEGHWAVNQKLLTPGNVNQISAAPVTPTEARSLVLTNTAGGTNQLVIVRGSQAAAATDPAGRVIRLSSADVGDVYDILSLGSEVTIRR